MRIKTKCDVADGEILFISPIINGVDQVRKDTLGRSISISLLGRMFIRRVPSHGMAGHFYEAIIDCLSILRTLRKARPYAIARNHCHDIVGRSYLPGGCARNEMKILMILGQIGSIHHAECMAFAS